MKRRTIIKRHNRYWRTYGRMLSALRFIVENPSNPYARGYYSHAVGRVNECPLWYKDVEFLTSYSNFDFVCRQWGK
jgi:hypothetical protein